MPTVTYIQANGSSQEIDLAPGTSLMQGNSVAIAYKQL